ncbi:hypothetical protein TSUD_356710 [Trifolium subterraneum]|uniref:Uncharacterized protein n=1 Tax=Trifolium subterraneum TaxID=3900 RepID=A0A2Z6MUK3_TRISU|nr:hypothetical protein TSUD_356710 [Trifolium subterraneum]
MSSSYCSLIFFCIALLEEVNVWVTGPNEWIRVGSKRIGSWDDLRISLYNYCSYGTSISAQQSLQDISQKTINMLRNYGKLGEGRCWKRLRL